MVWRTWFSILDYKMLGLPFHSISVLYFVDCLTLKFFFFYLPLIYSIWLPHLALQSFLRRDETCYYLDMDVVTRVNVLDKVQINIHISNLSSTCILVCSMTCFRSLKKNPFWCKLGWYWHRHLFLSMGRL